MKKYYNVYEFEEESLTSNIWENGKMITNPYHDPRPTFYDEFDESKIDYNSYLFELNRYKRYLEFEIHKNIHKSDGLVIDETLGDLIDSIDFFLGDMIVLNYAVDSIVEDSKISPLKYESEKQRFLIYEDDNYMVFSYVGRPENYELLDDNWLIVSKSFDTFCFIRPEDEFIGEDYHNYNLVTTYKRNKNSFTKEQIETDYLDFSIDYDCDKHSTDIDKFLSQKLVKRK